MMKQATRLRTVAPMVALGLLVGCGNGDGEPAIPEAPEEMPFDEATAGDVSGSVLFEGTPPAPQIVDMASEPDCAAAYDPDAPPTRDLVDVDDAGGLRNVFVYVKDGLEGMAFPRPADSPVMDQVACRYTPHMVGVMVGQPITFRNSDGLLHNINATPQINRGFNISQPVNMDTERTFAQPEIMIPVRCDVHGWMLGYLGVLDHPYHAVSSNDGGFDLSTLPPGEYVLEAWHSQLGVQEQTVTVETGETSDVSFTFTEGMLADAEVPMGEPIHPHFHDPVERIVGMASGHQH